MNSFLKITALCVAGTLLSCSNDLEQDFAQQTLSNKVINSDFSQISTDENGSDYFTGQVIRSYETRDEAKAAEFVLAREGAELIDHFYNDQAGIYLQLLGGEENGTLDDGGTAGKAGPDWHNMAISTDDLIFGQGQVLKQKTGQKSLATTNSDKVRVAIIDSGIDYEFLPFTKSLKAVSINDQDSKSFLSLDMISKGEGIDQLGHGSAVASMFFRDVAEENVELLSYKVTAGATDKISLFHGIAAIYLSALEEADFINLCWGFVVSNQENAKLLEDAIDYARLKGSVIVASAGNYGDDLSITKRVPSSFDQVLTVGAFDYKAGPVYSQYSNYSQAVVDVAALGSIQLAKDWSGSGNMNASGTSFAAPIVVNALIKERLDQEGNNKSRADLNQDALRSFKNKLDSKPEFALKVNGGHLLSIAENELSQTFH